MDFIYDFDGEMLDIIVKKALKKGYKIRICINHINLLLLSFILQIFQAIIHYF